ncbi:HmuY family protein [Myroides sp. LJL115]
MKNILKVLLLVCVFITVGSCQKDSTSGNNEQREFIVAFKEQSIPYGEITQPTSIPLLFSHNALEDGSVEVRVTTQQAVFGEDFSTIPSINQNNLLIIPFTKGDNSVDLIFENLNISDPKSDRVVTFTIEKINYSSATPVIRGFSVLTISYNASLGGVLAPNLGGPNEKNQVYVDLADRAMYPVRRDSWDLAFFSDGPEFVVKLNGSVYMAAGVINVSSMTETISDNMLKSLQEDIRIGTFDPYNIAYIDNPSGNLNQTAISAVDVIDRNNRVYLVNLGNEIGSDQGVIPGSVNVAGQPRGWMKIRVLIRDNAYLLQYSKPQEVVYKEVSIPKRAGFNFNFFSFNTQSIVNVEPSKDKWDLNFTVFTNTVDQNGAPMGSYGFSDFILQNRYANVQAYMIRIPEGEKTFYKDFTLDQIDPANFSYDLRIIGDTWRDVSVERVVYKDVFYVLKDSQGNYYKFRMLSFSDEKGNRGYPRFEYSLLY